MACYVDSENTAKIIKEEVVLGNCDWIRVSIENILENLLRYADKIVEVNLQGDHLYFYHGSITAENRDGHVCFTICYPKKGKTGII